MSTLCAADWRSNFTNVPYDEIAPVDELAIEILLYSVLPITCHFFHSEMWYDFTLRA
jgi:hypothetical protein